MHGFYLMKGLVAVLFPLFQCRYLRILQGSQRLQLCLLSPYIDQAMGRLQCTGILARVGGQHHIENVVMLAMICML